MGMGVAGQVDKYGLTGDVNEKVNKAYEYARDVYNAYGINTDDILEKMKGIRISLHCWQGDDVTGFETLS